MDDVVEENNTSKQAYIRKTYRAALVSFLCLGLAACGTTVAQRGPSKHGKEYFPESKYGVKASPRVATGKNIPKGGGRQMVGKPYQVAGKWYYPKEDFNYNKVGLASWYGSAFHGRKTANGEVYDQSHLSAAHPTFPLPSYARVTNLENGSSVIVRVNDRGPYDSNRVIDLSNKTAELLDVKRKGTAKVRVQYVGRARMDGHDMPYLMASYVKKGSRAPAFDPGNSIATGVMVASNDPVYQPAAEPVVNEGPVLAQQPVIAPVPVFKPEPQLASNDGSVQLSANALANEQPQAAAFDAALQEFGELPVFGPFPADRPSSMQLAQATSDNDIVAAYAETRIKTAASPFDAVLVRSESLTADAILSSFHRRNGQK